MHKRSILAPTTRHYDNWSDHHGELLLILSLLTLLVDWQFLDDPALIYSMLCTHLFQLREKGNGWTVMQHGINSYKGNNHCICHAKMDWTYVMQNGINLLSCKMGLIICHAKWDWDHVMQYEIDHVIQNEINHMSCNMRLIICHVKWDWDHVMQTGLIICHSKCDWSSVMQIRLIICHTKWINHVM